MDIFFTLLLILEDIGTWLELDETIDKTDLLQSILEANKIEIVKTDYSTRKLINEIATLANSRVGSKAVELKFEIDDKLPPVLYGDNLRIKQILTNLITNAIKYTKYGHVLFKIDSLNSTDKCRNAICKIPKI